MRIAQVIPIFEVHQVKSGILAPPFRDKPFAPYISSFVILFFWGETSSKPANSLDNDDAPGWSNREIFLFIVYVPLCSAFLCKNFWEMKPFN